MPTAASEDRRQSTVVHRAVSTIVLDLQVETGIDYYFDLYWSGIGTCMWYLKC